MLGSLMLHRLPYIALHDAKIAVMMCNLMMHRLLSLVLMVETVIVRYSCSYSLLYVARDIVSGRQFIAWVS